MTDGKRKKEGPKPSEGKTFYKSVATGTMEMNLADVEAVGKGWSWAIAAGILLILLGVLAIVYPALTTIGVVFLLGAVLIVGGIAQLVHAVTVRSWGGFFWHLLIAITYAVIGILLLMYPLGGLVTLTLLLAIYFIVSGILKIVVSISSRRATTNWGWMLFSGLLALLLGVLVWMSWPVSSLWFLGLLVGIDLILGGFSLAAMGMSAHSMMKERSS